MAELRVRLLGSPLVERDGASVMFDTRKATALLAYLAVTGQPQSRETLAALLWPDYDHVRGRAALRRTLSVLNSATGGDCLAVDRHATRLRPDRVIVDVAEFQRAAADVHHDHLAEESCERCVASLQTAAALYAGDFMAGFGLRDSPEYEGWQDFQTDSLRRQLADVLERLVHARVALGDVADAVNDARRWLSLDPLQERAHGALMRLYAWTGQRGAALKQYRECVRVLDRELGVPPLSQTTALYDAIRSDRLPPPAPVTAPARSSVVPGVNAPPRVNVPLVGRSQELAELQRARGLAGRTGRVVTVTGEAGIGKTRLLATVAAAASESGGSVVVARCHQGEEGLAFGLIADVLRTALRGGGSTAISLPVPWTVEVGRLLPELIAASRDLPEPPTLDSPGAQSRFYAALIGTLASSLGPGGVLLVEDLQWVDDSSAEVLAYLLRRLSDFRLLVALSWRPELLPARSPLHAALAEVARDGRLDRVELGRLDLTAVAELARAVLPDAVATPAMIERLYAETRGLPLFAVEYLDAFRRDAGVPGDAAWQLPGGVRDLLEARLTGMSETAEQVLAAAAVLGSDVDPVTLRSTSGRSDDEVVAAIDEARSHAVLVEVGGADRPGYEFAHEGLRGLVSTRTSLARRRLLHGRAADTLMSRRDAYELSATIAGHLHDAGRDGEGADWSWQAAERARSLYAHAEALEHLNNAVALGYPGHLVHQVVGDVLTVLGRYSQALIAYERAAAALDPDDQRSLATLEHKLAEVHHRLGEWELAESHLTAAAELIEDGVDPVLQARVLADLALVSHRRGNPERAAEIAHQALGLARSTRDDAALAQAFDVLGVLAWRRGDLTEATEHLEASLRHAAKLPDPSLRVAALNNLAVVHAAAGRPGDAVAVGREALARGLEHGDRHRAAALHTNLADLLHAAGEQDEAIDHLKAAARLFAEVDDEQLRRPEIWKLAQW